LDIKRKLVTILLFSYWWLSIRLGGLYRPSYSESAFVLLTEYPGIYMSPLKPYHAVCCQLRACFQCWEWVLLYMHILPCAMTYWMYLTSLHYSLSNLCYADVRRMFNWQSNINMFVLISEFLIAKQTSRGVAMCGCGLLPSFLNYCHHWFF
jgi:hypothetical protein